MQISRSVEHLRVGLASARRCIFGMQILILPDRLVASFVTSLPFSACDIFNDVFCGSILIVFCVLGFPLLLQRHKAFTSLPTSLHTQRRLEI